MNPEWFQLAVAVFAVLVTLCIAFFSYVVGQINRSVKASQDIARDMHISAKHYTAEAEARMMAQIKETEARAERGDDRVIGIFNGHIGEVNRQLGEIRRMLSGKQIAIGN